MISEKSKDSMSAAVGRVENAVKELGASYQQLLDEWERVKRDAFAQGGHNASNVASSTGPDRFNEDIYGSMLSAGLQPLLDRIAMRGDHRPIEDLVGAFLERARGA